MASNSNIKQPNAFEVQFLKDTQDMLAAFGRRENGQTILEDSPAETLTGLFNPEANEPLHLVASVVQGIIYRQGVDNTCSTIIQMAKNLSEISEENWGKDWHHLDAYLRAFEQCPPVLEPKKNVFNGMKF